VKATGNTLPKPCSQALFDEELQDPTLAQALAGPTDHEV